MSVQDHRAYRPTPAPARSGGRPLTSTVSPWLRWITEAVWFVEHAFERARADARPEEDTRVRIFLIQLVFAGVFAFLALGAAHAALMTPKGGSGVASVAGALRRADLTDRNGQLLATNITHYGLYIDPAEVWDREAALTRIRRVMPGISVERLRRVLNGDRRLIVQPGLTPTERQAIHALALGGVSFEPEDRRVYPLNRSGVHLIGIADTGGEGISGAELAFNDEIKAAGEAGETFPLSIDLRVQGILENELDVAATEAAAKGAVGVVADARTGEILGMASWPTYDANRRGSAPDAAALNRVTSAHFEMGSVFKTFTVAAAIDTGLADLDTMIDASQAYMIGNRRISDFHATNKILSLEEVYLHSSNIGTSRLAVEMGPDTMRTYFQRFGLLDAAPIELHESARPRRPRDWSDSTRASMSFGYGIMITPLQMTAATVSLVNGGVFRPLSLRVGGTGAEGRRVVSPQTSASIRELMRANVLRGSGGQADAAGLRVGGKTGSANKLVDGRYDARHGVGSFAAVFPADGPDDAQRYVIFVLIDEPGEGSRLGGAIAAPVVGRVVDRIAGFLGVQRRVDPPVAAEVAR
ncbi:MAG: penicillin-binding protein 2 [Alphaproteobacteria bacterium]|nr:penicillin-binding protein 2 [Alphaproteobacteria bacterium]MBU1539915.1 penicillin-binding protein 2 [Alphaproteobacteria bacterium]MBU2380107.1 penicillin-binding protein 2 [Alphaproteobacteria bacterium]